MLVDSSIQLCVQICYDDAQTLFTNGCGCPKDFATGPGVATQTDNECARVTTSPAFMAALLPSVLMATLGIVIYAILCA